MEKRKPHYNLSLIKRLTSEGKIVFSNAALSGASALSLDDLALAQVVANLQPKDFHISKMANTETKIWLDLYRPITHVGVVYLKIKVSDSVFIVSFVPKSATLSHVW